MATESQATPTPKAGRNLPVAIGVGVALFAALAASLLWLPWLFMIITAAGLSIGVVEVHQALQRKGMNSQVRTIVVGTVISILGGYWVHHHPGGVSPTAFAVISLVGTFLAAAVARLFLQPPVGFVRDVSASAFIIAYVPMMGLFIPLLVAQPQGPLRVILVIVCASAADTGAYAVGTLFGRHKMAPSISPSKTWEGFVGSILTAALIGAVAGMWILAAPWWLGALVGLCIAPAATVGDLVESVLKRDVGIKDMSNFLPGHGGIMDRLDSMLVAVPVGWLVLHLSLGGWT